MMERTNVVDRLEALLSGAGVPFRLYAHEPVFTSEQAAAVRGTSPEEGAKALLVKADDDFLLAVISGPVRVDSKKLRRLLGASGTRFATEQELLDLTGCRPGSLPPFGCLFGLPVLMDDSLRGCDRISFNAGSNSWSVTMKREDYERIAIPRVDSFALGGSVQASFI